MRSSGVVQVRVWPLTGMPREEILRRGVIGSEIPMYGVLGTAGMGAIADQARYGRE